MNGEDLNLTLKDNLEHYIESAREAGFEEVIKPEEEHSLEKSC